MHGTTNPIAALVVSLAENAKEIMAYRRRITNQAQLDRLTSKGNDK